MACKETAYSSHLQLSTNATWHTPAQHSWVIPTPGEPLLNTLLVLQDSGIACCKKYLLRSLSMLYPKPIPLPDWDCSLLLERGLNPTYTHTWEGKKSSAAALVVSAQSTKKQLGRKAALLLRIAFCHENKLHDTQLGYFYLCQWHISCNVMLAKRGVRISSRLSSYQHCLPGWLETGSPASSSSSGAAWSRKGHQEIFFHRCVHC